MKSFAAQNHPERKRRGSFRITVERTEREGVWGREEKACPSLRSG